MAILQVLHILNQYSISLFGIKLIAGKKPRESWSFKLLKAKIDVK